MQNADFSKFRQSKACITMKLLHSLQSATERWAQSCSKQLVPTVVHVNAAAVFTRRAAAVNMAVDRALWSQVCWRQRVTHKHGDKALRKQHRAALTIREPAVITSSLLAQLLKHPFIRITHKTRARRSNNDCCYPIAYMALTRITYATAQRSKQAATPNVTQPCSLRGANEAVRA